MSSVRTCLSASEFSVYFYYYTYIYISSLGSYLRVTWYTISSTLSFVDVLRQHACQLLNSLSMHFYSILFKILVHTLYVPYSLIPFQLPYFACGFSIPHPLFSTSIFPHYDNRYWIQQQYLPTKMHLSFPFKRRELFN